LKKITEKYMVDVVKPKAILSDHGTQFTSPVWKQTLSKLNIEVRYSPIRSPQSNPCERFMRELGKFFKMYCNHNHRLWPELISHTEEWLNSTSSDATRHSPVELTNKDKPEFFANLPPLCPGKPPEGLTREEKALRAYARMRNRANERESKRKRGSHKWEPSLSDAVLLREQHIPDAAQGVTAKFLRPYEGPYYITKFINPSTYEISDPQGKIRGAFHKRLLKPFRFEEQTE
jgi:hypothetical protein